MNDEERRALRERERALMRAGYVRCSVYTGNMARMWNISVERGPGISPDNSRESDWVPAWFEWHLQRFPQNGVTQRSRMEEAQRLLLDRRGQLMLLIEAQLAGGTLNDPLGDLATEAAIHLLKEEFDAQEKGSEGP